MTGRRKKKQSGQTSLKEFVTVAYAEDMELAKQYKKMLKADGIPVAIKSQNESSGYFPGIAVMVPEDYLDEAHVLIESHSAYDDFYDTAFHDDPYEALDEDIYDDEF